MNRRGFLGRMAAVVAGAAVAPKLFAASPPPTVTAAKEFQHKPFGYGFSVAAEDIQAGDHLVLQHNGAAVSRARSVQEQLVGVALHATPKGSSVWMLGRRS